MVNFFKKIGIDQLLTVIFFLSIFIFYFWTGSNGILKHLYEERWGGASGYPLMLADSFIKGNTYLAAVPKSELLELSDPYDPNLNDHFRMHDASLYKGKYYLYFSPVVPLLIIAPVRFLTGYFLSEPFLTSTFACIGFLFSCLSFAKILNIAKLKPSKTFIFASFLVLATLTNVPFLLRRPAIYELCIISSYAFLMIGFYFYLTSFQNLVKSTKILFASGIFFSLCIASRPNLFLTILVLVLGYYFLRRKFYKEEVKQTFYLILILTGPILITFVVLAIYNYVRFDSIFEFGMKYQLTGIDTKKVPLFSFGRLLGNLYVYFFHPFNLAPVFPFINITEPLKPQFLANIWFTERTLGFFSYPLFWLSLSSVFVIRQIALRHQFLIRLLGLLLLSSAINIILLSNLHGITMRYMIDFMPFLIISALILIYISSTLIFSRGKSGECASAYFFYSSVLLSCLVSILSSLTGTYDVFQAINPDLYNYLKSFFIR